MVAYGEVESVWPAVGTVMVHDGVAYANAGRTSDSDGGIAVVALDPATGAHRWGKAVAAGQRMNDLLAVRDGQVAWYNQRLDAKTGETKPAATVPKDPSMSGMLDGAWTVVPIRRSGNGFAAGSVVANLLAWNEKLIVSPKAAMARDKDGLPAEASAKAGSLWTTPFARPQQVEAIALAPEAALFAGRTTGADGKLAGFLAMFAAADGKKLAELPLWAPPTYDGLAIANGRVYVSLQDGSVVCFGKGD